MSTINRRTLFAAMVAGGALAAAPLTTWASAPGARGARWLGAGAVEHVYDPSPADGPKRYLNDHCTIQAEDGTWHLFSIIGDSAPPGQFPDGGLEDNIAHATAPDIRGPWTTQEHVLTTDPGYHGEDHLWAPHVIEHDGTYYMFYAAGGDGAAMNLATSPDLYTWTRIPEGPLFRGRAARDAMVVRIGEQWVMYYCEIAEDGRHIVAARTSTDLRVWSEPSSVFDDLTFDGSAASMTESPYLVERDGWWYLFIGPRNGYVGTDVFASQDPFAFGVDGYAGHLPVHCAEIGHSGEEWWITAAGSFHDGLYVAPLRWLDAPPVWHGPHNPAVARDVSGGLRLFALAQDRSTVVTRTLDEDWSDFGSDFASVPTIGAAADGALTVFALRSNGKLAARTQNADGGWKEWADFGGPFAAPPAVVRDADDRMHLFALGQAGQHIQWRRQLDEGQWSEWEEFGDAAGAPPAAGVNADGRIEVFAIGSAGAYLANRWQHTPAGEWSDWDTAFGGPAGAMPSVALGAADRLQVTAIAPVGTGIHLRGQAEPSSGWQEWEGFGPWTDCAATLIPEADSRLLALYMPPGGATIHHRRQQEDGTWGEPAEFGAGPAASVPSGCLDADGLLHVFAVAPDGTVHTRAQATPGGDWGEWRVLEGATIAPVPAGSAT